MKILEIPKIELPSGMDVLCVDLCNLLNRLLDTETFESCSGHTKHPYWIFFHCTNIEVLSRLGRCVSRNYSDGNWEILVDSTDTNPIGCFWLRTKDTLPFEELVKSLIQLEDNILHWFKDEFDEHFNAPSIC